MQWWAHFFVLFFEVTHVGNLKVPCLLLTQYPITINLVKKFGGKGFLCSRHSFSTHFERTLTWQLQVYIELLLQLGPSHNTFCNCTTIGFWGNGHLLVWSGSLLRILWCSQSHGNHSKNILAKFGYILDMKVEKKKSFYICDLL
jgi:hypothetical protein